MAGTWISCTSPPILPSGQFMPDTMLLLSDGSVLVHNSGGSAADQWLRYRPNGHGNYAHGAWSAAGASATAREFFASGVLRDGRVFVIGGEDSSAGSDTPLGEIYDPVMNVWTPLVKPPGFDFIHGDASSCILADGRVLFGGLTTAETAIWDPAQDSWVEAGTRFGTVPGTKSTRSNEETWTLLPDGSVLTVETFWTAPKVNAAQKYLPEFDIWVDAGSTPQNLALQTVKGVNVFEIGPAILLPNGMVFAIGGTGNTALYSPPLTDPTQAGVWFSGPTFPADTSVGANWPLLTCSDGPACLQPNGKVLCVAGTTTLYSGDYFSQNAQVYEYDPSNPVATLPLLPVQPPISSNPWTWEVRFLLLPTGEILYSAGEAGEVNLHLYRPDGRPNPRWRPDILDVPERLRPGHSYRLYGRQLNGLSQAVSYGDDAQAATNFPVIRLRSWDGLAVHYCRTFQHSTMAVATGHAVHHTHFTVPAGLPYGTYELQVIANGIASEAERVELGMSDSVREDDEEEDEPMRREETRPHEAPQIAPPEHILDKLLNFAHAVGAGSRRSDGATPEATTLPVSKTPAH